MDIAPSCISKIIEKTHKPQLTYESIHREIYMEGNLLSN